MNDRHWVFPSQVAIVLVLGFGLHADANLKPPSTPASESFCPTHGSLAAVSCLDASAPCPDDEEEWPEYGFSAASRFHPSLEPQTDAVHEIHSLPPVPGSASLFLFALGSLGALRACRSMARPSPDTSPEWFFSASTRQGEPATATSPIPYVFFFFQPCSLGNPFDSSVTISIPGHGYQYDRFLSHILIPRGPPPYSLVPDLHVGLWGNEVLTTCHGVRVNETGTLHVL